MMSILPAVGAGVNFMLHSAGWLEGGLFAPVLVMDADQLAMIHIMQGGVDLSENGQAMDAIAEVGPSGFLGCDHTNRNYQTAFYNPRPTRPSSSSGKSRARRTCINAPMHAEADDQGLRHPRPGDRSGRGRALTAYIRQRKDSMPDALY